ncbi:hypothetical protein [Natronomonas sp. EA1]|uniref:hypothetical protein n=1 Tax=Natronomonas sp. EA1 TaxID=3421655 RepID=UPI003EB76B11
MNDDEGYVHTPDTDEPTADPADREFDWRGWVLVGWIIVALVIVPSYLFYFPHAGETVSLFGLGYRDTYLFVPLIPAIVLGALAVWATTRP